MRRVTKRHGPVLSDFDEPAGGSTVKRLSATPDMTLTKHISNTSPSQTNIGYHLVDHGYGATPQHQIMREIPLAPPKTTEAVKRRLNLNMTGVVSVPARPKFKTPKQRSPRGSPAQGSRGGKKIERTRYDTSLGLLTKKFVQLLQSSPDGVVDLNVASVSLEVQKRRIYDITNVLEGIGILEKKSKNNIQWKCGKVGNPDIGTLEKEMRTLEQKENLLDALIQSAECELRQLSENKRYAYITYGDLKSIPDFKDQTVIGIKAPPEAQLQVPNPSNGYEIYMKTETGEIEVFVCPENVQPTLPFPPVDPLLQDIKPLLTPVYEDMKQLVSPKMKNRPLTRHLGTAQRNLNDSLNFSESPVKKKIKVEPEMQQPTVTLPVLTPSKPSSSTTRVSRDLALNSVTDPSTSIMTVEQKFQLASALISEADDFGPMGGSLQLQIEDQHQDEPFEPFLSLEPPLGELDYSFSLGNAEGLTDLFDFDY